MLEQPRNVTAHLPKRSRWTHRTVDLSGVGYVAKDINGNPMDLGLGEVQVARRWYRMWHWLAYHLRLTKRWKRISSIEVVDSPPQRKA